MDNKKICSNCGSSYKLSYTRITMRDKDAINCEVCEQVLHRWSEAKIWEAELLERKENHIT